MANIEGICFEPSLRLLVCTVHGTGIHPDAAAIKRHLRGERHYCKREALDAAVSALTRLPLQSRQDLLDAHPPLAAQPVPAVPYLAIKLGWSCRICHGQNLTTSEELRDRHVATLHRLRPRSHCEEQPLWDACQLQTLFSMTRDIRCFRVRAHSMLSNDDLVQRSGRSNEQSSTDEGDEQQRQSTSFVEHFRMQQEQHESIAAAAANTNPDPSKQDTGVELWMKRLGVSQYVAGLRKDEMVDSYKSSELDDSAALIDLREVSVKVLRETWRWCQHGAAQRMTDPQAARISSFWHAADPEGRNKTFGRAIKQETLDAYLSD